jgi:glutaredoxin 3
MDFDIMKNIVIYTQDMCGYCTAAKEEFESREWDYTAHNIKHTDNYDNLKALLPEVKTVPQIWIDDVYIGGYDELKKWLLVPKITAAGKRTRQEWPGPGV